MYIDATAVVTGGHLYDSNWQRSAFQEQIGTGPPQGVFYPPSTGFAALPFAALPYRYAQQCWFLILVLSVVVGTRALVQLARPHARPGTWQVVSGLVLLCACVRWGMTPLQGAPLVLGLLAIFVVGLHRQRWSVVFLVAAFVTALKFTIALPFLGLLLLHRRYALGLAAAALGASLNVLGFMRLGGMTALREYRTGIQGLESFHLINTPDPWDPQSSPRLDWVYLFEGLTEHLTFSRAVTFVLSVLVALWLVREGARVTRPVSLGLTAAFLMPLVCLSVLCVYHHQYDICAALVPLLLLLGAQSPKSELQADPRGLFLMLPLVLMMVLLPVATTQRLLTTAFGVHGAGLMNIAFPTATTLALVGSLIILRGALQPFDLKRYELRSSVGGGRL